MTQLEKLITKILKGQSKIKLSEAIKLLKSLNYVASNPVGSHQTWRKENKDSITLVITQKELKPYQVQKLQTMLNKEGYTHETTE